MIGAIVHGPTRKARIVVCSMLLGIALLEILDDDGKPTGRHAYCDPNDLRLRDEPA